MIFGIGTDLCEVSRIEKSIARLTFVRHVFAESEQALLAGRTGKAKTESAAANFAGKEAFLKACGTGLAGFALREIAVLREESTGAPYLAFTGEAAAWMQARRLRANISLTHDGGLASAFVILEEN